MSFELTFLGGFQALADGQPVKFATNFARALLAYLTIEARPCDRTTLVGLLWPDQPEPSARQSLRQTLFYLRQALGEAKVNEQTLIVTTKSLQVQGADVELDVWRFQQLLATCTAHAHHDLLTCPACIERFRQAADLYRGEFLHGLVVKGSQPFEEWALFLREQLHRRAIEVYYTLAQHSQGAGDYEQMQRYAARQLALEPWREEAHRQVMWALAASGQRSAALVHYNTCRQVLARELGVEPDRETAVLYEQIRAGHFAQSSPFTTPTVRQPPSPFLPHTRPAVLTPLIGRERELAELIARLQQPDVRLLTLVGLGGMGKTRLALAVAASVAPQFTAGVCIVELAELTDPALVPQAVAGALGQTDQPEATGLDVVASYLRDKHLLLVLDNCEHLREAVAHWIKQWLSACPLVSILATSHGALTITGEQVWLVPALAYPPPAPGLSPDELLTFEAVKLFVTRAKEVRSNFALTRANSNAVAEICRKLEGIPLALELAAARIRLLPPAEIAVHLSQCIDAAVAGNRSAPERHQTMRAALDWSFDSLDAGEQTLLQQLALFSGGFSLSAVEAITDLPDMLNVLFHLLDRALITSQALGDQIRYRMPTIIREYALDKLRQSGDLQRMHQRHAAYFLQLVEHAQLDLQADGGALWLQPEADNLKNAIEWALANGHHSLAVRLAGALTWYWWMRGYLHALRTPLQQALAQLERAGGDIAVTPPLALPVPAAGGRALLPLAAGALLALWEEPVKAQVAFTQALALAETEQNEATAGIALRRLAEVAIHQKAYAAANEFIARGLAIWQRLGAIWHIAWLYAYQGDLLAHTKLPRECQLATWLAAALKARDAGDAQPALQYAEQANRLNEQGEILFRLVDTTLILGHAHAVAGHWEAAAAAFQQALDACVELDKPALAAEPQAGLAQIALAQGDLAGALAQVEAILPVLGEEPRAGYNNSCFIYLTGYRVLAANADPRAAALLQQGYDLLQQDAAALDDESRHRFLTAVPIHRDLIAAYTEMQAQRDEAISPSPLTLSPSHPGILPEQALSPLHDWGEMPAVEQMQGRSAELKQLAGWLGLQENGERGQYCRVVAVLGMGGTGKTTLAAALAKAAAPMFEVVIWRSLLNAPPLAEVLGQWLQMLSRQMLHTLPGSLAEQLRLLLEYLRRQRCLLVLDNLESILQPGTSGAMRPDYEGYDQLLQQVGGSEHQSVLLLTSREQPQALTRLLGPNTLVRILPLAGLDSGAGHALLQAHGITATATETQALVAHYSGNPLALQLVAQTVQDLFAGQIGSFLTAGAPIFDDIRTVLDQQYARLSTFEQEILRWLALERQPISLQTLRDNLLQPPPAHRLLEALRSLQRRSLLETIGNDFTLQNVVMEYVTARLVEEVCAELLGVDEARGGALEPLALFNRHALLNAQAQASVRLSQARLILQPIAERLQREVGADGLAARFQQILAGLRGRTREAVVAPGYAAGNILNLLLHMGTPRLNADFSHLAVWRADLRGAYLPNFDFTGADLTGSVFTHSFGRLGTLLFDANNELMLVDMVDNRLRLWRLADATLRQEYVLPDLPVFWVIMSSDCNTLAFLTIDHQLVLVDLAAHRQLPPLRRHAHPIWRCFFSPDDRLLISGDTSGLVCVWDCPSGQLVQARQLADQAITALAMAPDGETIASATVDGTVFLWSLRNDRLMQTLQGHTAEVATLSFAQNGDLLASGSHDTTVGVWEVRSGQLRYRLHGHTRPIRRSVARGHWLVTGGVDPFVYLWDLEHGTAKHMLASHGSGLEQLALSPDNKTVAIVDRDTVVSLWDAQHGQRMDSFPIHRNIITSVDFSPDGATMVSGGGDGALYLWQVDDASMAQIIARIPAHKHRIVAVAFSVDGQWIASGDDDHLIRLWDRASHRLWRTLDGHTGSISGLAFSPDGRLLASSSGDGTVGVWSMPDGQQVHRLVGHNNVVGCCAFSPVGGAGQRGPRLLASGSLDHTLVLWDADRGEVYRRLLGHTNGISRCLFSADGRRLISVSYDRTCGVWDTATGQRLAAWETTNTTYIALARHPAGAVLAVSGDDHVIRLLELETGQCVGELRGHREFIDSLCFHPNGQWLASASGDGTVRLWDIADAIQRGGRNPELQTLSTPGPYAGMQITGMTGISMAQKAALRTLGAVEN